MSKMIEEIPSDSRIAIEKYFAVARHSREESSAARTAAALSNVQKPVSISSPQPGERRADRKTDPQVRSERFPI
ncbi:hypothetical protein [Sphingobium chungbukense]|uniref:hypothetical protein n=1 Tax=Sphingobium chungbukense TaxID=56193 RepID=UPI0018DD9577|nr:hypothetical protein [Sphingobium chungbukense]